MRLDVGDGHDYRNEIRSRRRYTEEKFLTDILGLDISVDEIALFVEVLQAKQQLARDAFDKTRRDAFAPVLLDESEQVLAERLERHADVLPARRGMAKRVEERHNMSTTVVCG